MSRTEPLLEIKYHTDDENGRNYIGEVDFGIYGTFDDYVKQYGRIGLNEVLLKLTHLIWHVTEYGGAIIKANDVPVVNEQEKTAIEREYMKRQGSEWEDGH